MLCSFVFSAAVSFQVLAGVSSIFLREFSAIFSDVRNTFQSGVLDVAAFIDSSTNKLNNGSSSRAPTPMSPLPGNSKASVPGLGTNAGDAIYYAIHRYFNQRPTHRRTNPALRPWTK
ncbi:hypothetical protein C8F04DRAFT_1113086 [Mycena alexandri]|uniref:Uncharacterized protein n=1 Tax=Mycena alexandri TaxID=1745969 RepID=A0AAD6X0S9_9AGAR|nr:hypothetical protein C8F04DRAFT_1113086 [Mycena alexandri]